MKKKFNLSNAKIRIIAIALSVVAALSAVGVIAGVNTGFFGGKSNPTSSTTSVEKKMADAERKIKQVQAQAAADKKAAEKQSQEQAAKEKEKKDEQDKRAENEKKIESLEKLLDELKEELKDKSDSEKKSNDKIDALEKQIEKLLDEIRKLKEKIDPTQPATSPQSGNS